MPIGICKLCLAGWPGPYRHIESRGCPVQALLGRGFSVWIESQNPHPFDFGQGRL